MADRRALLIAAPGFLQLKPQSPELRLLHRLLDSWSGVGHVVVGMERQGYDVSLGKIHDDGWRAAFYSNPMLSSAGFAVACTPWQAVQQAARVALRLSSTQTTDGPPLQAADCGTPGASRDAPQVRSPLGR